jgi:hypothetical protein
MWVAVFVSYFNGIKSETILQAAADPQVAINASKEYLMLETAQHWTEVPAEDLGRRILIREVQRSKPAVPVQEYGWLYAVKPQEVGSYASQQIVEDMTASLR